MATVDGPPWTMTLPSGAAGAQPSRPADAPLGSAFIAGAPWRTNGERRYSGVKLHMEPPLLAGNKGDRPSPCRLRRGHVTQHCRARLSRDRGYLLTPLICAQAVVYTRWRAATSEAIAKRKGVVSTTRCVAVYWLFRRNTRTLRQPGRESALQPRHQSDLPLRMSHTTTIGNRLP